MFKRTILAAAISVISCNAFCVTDGFSLEKVNTTDQVYYNCTGTIIGGDWVLTTEHCGETMNHGNGLGYHYGKNDKTVNGGKGKFGKVFVNGKKYDVVPNSFVKHTMTNEEEAYFNFGGENERSNERTYQTAIFKLAKKPNINTIHFIQNKGIVPVFIAHNKFKPIYMIGYGEANTSNLHEQMAKFLTFENDNNGYYQNDQGYFIPSQITYFDDKNGNLYAEPLAVYFLDIAALSPRNNEGQYKGKNVHGDSGAPYLNENGEIVGINYGVRETNGSDKRDAYTIGDDLGRFLKFNDIILKSINGWHYPTYITTSGKDSGQQYPQIKDAATKEINQVDADLNKKAKESLAIYKEDKTIKIDFPIYAGNGKNKNVPYEYLEWLGNTNPELKDANDYATYLRFFADIELGRQAIKIADAAPMPTYSTETKVSDNSGESVYTVTIQSLHKDEIKPEIFADGDVTIIPDSEDKTDCNYIDSIKPYETCTIKVSSNGGEGTIYLDSDKNQVIKVNPHIEAVNYNINNDAVPYPVPDAVPAPAKKDKGGSVGFLSLLGLAGLAFARTLGRKKQI